MSEAAPLPEVQVVNNLDGGATPTENAADLSGGRKRRYRVRGGELQGGRSRRSRSRSRSRSRRSRRSRRRMGGGETAETDAVLQGGRMRMRGMYGMGMYGGETAKLEGGRRRRSHGRR
jgi:hypothetical protein